MNYKKLTLDNKDIYEKYTQKRYINSEASFANMYIWRNAIDLHFSIVNEMLVLRITKDGIYKFIMPFGNDENILGCIEELLIYCKEKNQSLEILGANSNFINVASKKYDFSYEDSRNQRDYIYLTEKLATLSGKKLHSKKNHINKFKSTYSYTYKPIDANDFAVCLEKSNEWLNEKYNGEYNKYKTELETIEDAFNNFNALSLFGGALYVDGNMVAFTVGEELTYDTVIVHIEKADVNYNGAFTMINYEFQKSLANKYKFANREEDMGIEGLRKAKLSYQPEFLTEKYTCVFK